MASAPANIRTFIAPLKGPGRCAPALLEDLTLHDPRAHNPPGRNILRDSPFNFVDTPTLGDALPPNACRHVFCLKPRQSQLPALDELPGPTTVWMVAAFCRKCRIHLSLDVDYTVRFEQSPCPNAERPFHHLQRSDWRESLRRNAWLRRYPDTQDEFYAYECSSEGCSAKVTVQLSPPVMQDRSVHTLIDHDLLRERTEEAFRTKDGNTEGMKSPQPVDVLSDLRAYIRNAWREEPKYRNINVLNKRFIVRFGPDGSPCKDILEELNFKLQPGECWQVPEPNREEDVPFQDPINILLDNAEHELSALILARPVEERQHAADNTALTLASRELARTIGCLDYDKHPSSRAVKTDPALRTNEYTVLGAVQTLSDNGILSCYKWESQNNPDTNPYLLKALKQIAAARNSELLQTEAVFEQSNGKFDADDLGKAYRYFDLALCDDRIDDNYIIGLFSSRLEDSPMQEHDMRQNLRIIGIYRNSKRIIETAENVMNTYEQALQFLGADASVSDDHIQAFFAVKLGDNKSFEEQSMKAVKIIAQHRNSALLNNWISSGFTSDMHMDASEGYQALQIDNRTVDDDLIITQYDVIVQDNPASVEFYNRALTAIANDRNSTALRDHLQGSSARSSQGTLEEPVGLDNIGNTCYLNSLLQFLFTIAELRRVVLDFDAFKMELNEANMLQKKVGQRKVTKREVETAQKFVASLASLFKGMIETPQSAIRPQQELARLTLETDSAKEKIRRRSTMMSDRPSLGHFDSQPLLGPLQMPNSQANAVTDDMAIQSPTELESTAAFFADHGHSASQQDQGETDVVNITDNSSEATLVSRPPSEGSQTIEIPTAEQQQEILDNKENVSPTKTDAPPRHVGFEDQDAEPLRTSSPSKLNAQAGVLSNKDDGHIPELPMMYQPPPGKPPPVPPRKPVESSTDILEEYARQQDVTEVIAHCLFQFSCAVRPTGIDKSGEQLDEIHNLFFGQNISHTVPEKETAESVQFFSIITRVAHEPSDIYAALDTEYDLSFRDNGSQAFLSLAELPPVFSIALDRVIWDKQANRPAKLNHHVHIPETIFLDRYIESPPGSDLIQRRITAWEIKKELAILTERRKTLEENHAQSLNLPGLFSDAKFVLEHLQTDVSEDEEFGGSLNISPGVITTLGLLAEETQAELEVITKRMEDLSQQIKEAFVDMRKHPYRLHAAFFHRGSAGGGHYWVYIHDHKKEIWRRYNDDRVNIVDNRNEIFGRPQQDNSTWGAPPNPYFLVYVREDRIDELVETVKRDIVHPPPTEPPPVPARNQMSEMPPPSFSGFGASAGSPVSARGDIYNAGEQPQHNSSANVVCAPAASLAPKHGDWDDSELMVDLPRKW